MTRYCHNTQHALYISHSPVQVQHQGFYGMFFVLFYISNCPITRIASYSCFLWAESLLYRFLLWQLWLLRELRGQKAQQLALNFWPDGQNDEAGAKRRAWCIEIKPQAIRAGQGAILGHECCITHIDLLLLLLLTQPTLPDSRFGLNQLCGLEERDC